MNKITTLLSLLLIIFTVCGCQQPEELHNPAVFKSGSEELWTACKDELTARGFSIGFQNRKAGIIETNPLTSKQWFEFWRNDVVDSSSTIKSSMHTTNRVITLNINSDDSSVECTAKINRQYDKYTEKAPPVITEDSLIATSYILIREDDNKTPKTWAYIGRDSKLEQSILQSISKRIKIFKQKKN